MPGDIHGGQSHMKRKISDDVVALYKYATRDGFLYARAFPGSGYGRFLNDLQLKLKNREITLREAFDCVNKFVPLMPHGDRS